MADPDFLKFFPEAKLIEHENADLVDFGDGNPVDLLRGAVAGGAGEAWQWGAKAPTMPGGQGAPLGRDGLPRWGPPTDGGGPQGPGMNQFAYRNLAGGPRPYQPPTMGDFVAPPPDEQYLP
jgi:hypothetical protein